MTERLLDTHVADVFRALVDIGRELFAQLTAAFKRVGEACRAMLEGLRRYQRLTRTSSRAERRADRRRLIAMLREQRRLNRRSLGT